MPNKPFSLNRKKIEDKIIDLQSKGYNIALYLIFLKYLDPDGLSLEIEKNATDFNASLSKITINPDEGIFNNMDLSYNDIIHLQNENYDIEKVISQCIDSKKNSDFVKNTINQENSSVKTPPRRKSSREKHLDKNPLNLGEAAIEFTQSKGARYLSDQKSSKPSDSEISKEFRDPNREIFFAISPSSEEGQEKPLQNNNHDNSFYELSSDSDEDLNDVLNEDLGEGCNSGYISPPSTNSPTSSKAKHIKNKKKNKEIT